MQIIVMGMHRSGTSAVTRLINMLGAYLGPEGDIGGPAADNRKGFWERRDVRDLNDRILDVLGCSWSEVVDLDLNRLEEEERDKISKDLEKVVFNLDGQRPWVLKDPRLSLTFPLWRPLLEMPLCVIAYRSPLEVAASLNERNGLPCAIGLALWERYITSALNVSQGLPRIIVAFSDLMQDPYGVICRLEQFFVKNDVHRINLPSEREVKAFIDPDLYHKRTSREELAGYITCSQQDLLHALEDGSALDRTDPYQLSPLSNELLELFGSNNAEILAQERQRFSVLLGEHQSLVGEHQALVGEHQSLVGEHQALVGEHQALVGEHQSLVGEHQSLLERHRLSLDEKDALLSQKNKIINQAKQTLRKKANELAELRLRLADKAMLAKGNESKLLDQVRSLVELSGQQASNESMRGLVFLEGELRMLRDWLSQTGHYFDLTLSSWRWRTGDKLARIIENMLRRPRPTLAADHLLNIINQFKQWDKGYQTRINAAAGSSPSAIKLPSPPSPPASPPAASPTPSMPAVLAPKYFSSKYDLICFANIEWEARFQRPQQIATQFARHGHRVFYVIASRHLPPEHPAGFEAQEVAPGVFQVILSSPGGYDLYVGRFNTSQQIAFFRSMEKLRKAFSIVDAVSHVHLAFWTPLVLQLRDHWSWLVVYDCMDEWEGFPNIGSPLLEMEKTLVKQSQLITTSAALLEKKWREKNNDTLLVRNGVDYEFFQTKYQPHPDLMSFSHPIIGFYGGLAEWVDYALLYFVASSRPDWQLVLLGDVFVKDLAGLDKLPNVHLLGRKPYEDMPRYLYHFDVCLIPFKLYEVTHAVDPVKLYEYISAGKPVVSVPLEELAIYKEIIYFGEAPEEYLAAIELAIAEDNPVRQEKRKAVARSNDWAERFRLIDGSIRQRVPKVSIIIVTYKNLDLTRMCIDSVLSNTTHPNYELILVDNHSGDGTAEYLRGLEGHHDNIKTIINSENRGFAAANNQGLKLAQGDVLVLLNNDTVTPRGWLAPLLNHLRDPKIGLVGPLTNFVGNEAKIDVPYTKIEDMQSFAIQQMQENVGGHFDINVLAMFCVAMRRDAYLQVGLLDEGFGVGMFEDDDYSNRMKEKGYRVVCAEDAFVHHVGQAAFKQLLATGEYQDIWDKNQAYFEQKWGKWQAHRHKE
jgi:GT2 family glycosyltransferase/glycosyltransferase involved in cell wall biosynthesis